MQRKKLFYIPGLISIIVLPVLLVLYGPQDPVYQNCMRLNMPSLAKDTPGVDRFTKGTIYRALKNKKIITVEVDLNPGPPEWEEYIQNEKLAFIKREIERIQFTNDTSSVLKIEFGENCSYGTFIRVLNHAHVYNFKRYALIDNELYFFPEARFIPYKMPGLSDQSYVMPKREEPAKWALFKLDLQYKYWHWKDQFDYLFYQQKQNKLLAAGFLLLVAIPAIIKIRRYSRNKKLYYSDHQLSS